ncbi:FAD dependent oxidoreductase [Aaosphaeria arxii CBS 175.79]|uniref:FAD dependent oxidoreductase n=1 Tax=Aaosphaeria arxii CBS 175.79 TaxID=1450172 RepID=A0A6A5X741_9PLEO|nr:FAD dependent oxidoreductase [Aaosphaeria arxii CBS 175.79]KAF2008758.1 FAD dependent oxidoreductase [Aaosphaeria arxii CBS 175.79]
MYPVPHPVPSYWLSEPHKLHDVRSTPDLPPRTDVLIIGSGMAGIMTAYHFLEGSSSPNSESPSVVLLEARELCSGATARNGGHCKIKTNTLAGLIGSRNLEDIDELQAYVMGVMDDIKHIVEKEELDCQLELRRSFDVQTDAEDSKRLKKLFDDSRAKGARWTKDTSFIDERYAEQITSIKGATSAFSVPACSFWPYKFATLLVERLLERYPGKLNVQTNTLVKSVKQQENGTNLVTTARGDIAAAKVVFATNAYTAGLLPQFENVIVPVRGMATHIVPSKPVRPHLTQTYNIDFGADKGVDYLNPRPDGSIVVGGGGWHFKSDCKSWFNNFDDSARFSDDVEQHWKGYMQRTFHGWDDSNAVSDATWVGIMGNTPDGWSHVGRVPGTKSQWILAGFNGGGMALIFTAAKAVAKMVREDCDFAQVRKEFGIPALFGTSTERLEKGFGE